MLIQFIKSVTMYITIGYALVLFASFILNYHIYEAAINFNYEKRAHTPRSVTNDDLKDLVALTNETYFREVLDTILVPRVVGTQSHEKVKEFIGSELASLGYETEYDEFENITPKFGKLKFTNVIGRLDPQASRFLALACHYDSKYFDEFNFLGATDSAVPCAMLIHLAKVLSPYIKNANPRVGLMLIFFDGEEAFVNWSKEDSLYGARNLAHKWSKSENLNRMDMLMLLDLLGTKDTKFYSFFPETERWHLLLAQIEKRLKVSALIPNYQPIHFLEKSTVGFIEDDHIPFLQRDVPIVHVIPARFPSVWHTSKDDYSALDFPTISTLNKILQVFVYSYIFGDLRDLPN